MRKFWFILAAPLVLASCISVLPKPGPDPDIFRLSEITLPDVLADTPVVLVELPSTPKALRNNRLSVVQDNQSIAYTAGARWAAPVPQIMAEVLSDSLLATGRINVVSPQDGMHPQFALITEIRHFEIVYDRGEQSAPLGRVSIRAKLIDRYSRTVLAQHHVNFTVRASENRLGPMAAAVDDAAHKAARELGQWAADQLTTNEVTP